MSQLKYWVWLSQMERLKAHKRTQLLLHFETLEHLYYADERELKGVPGLDEQDIKLLLNKELYGAERILEKCAMGNISIMTMQDAAYPSLLRNIPDPPALLYYKGHMPSFDNEIGIAVIGTRSPSGYGLSVAERIAFDIAKGGGYIVSGLARGLDSQAHVGALKAGKPTAAVLGCGVDVVYPPENRSLYEDIAMAGVLISEYPPGSGPEPWHFPERNRIISGLTLGTLIIEAGEKSGTLITARHAYEQGRDLFAIPGAINAPMSTGTNALIRDDYAKLVTCAADVLCEYENYRAIKLPEPSREPAVGDLPEPEPKLAPLKEAAVFDKTKIKELPELHQKILLFLGDKPKHIDDIIEETGLEPSRANAEITMLLLEDFIEELAGRRYKLGKKVLI